MAKLHQFVDVFQRNRITEGVGAANRQWTRKPESSVKLVCIGCEEASRGSARQGVTVS